MSRNVQPVRFLQAILRRGIEISARSNEQKIIAIDIFSRFQTIHQQFSQIEQNIHAVITVKLC